MIDSLEFAELYSSGEDPVSMCDALGVSFEELDKTRKKLGFPVWKGMRKYGVVTNTKQHKVKKTVIADPRCKYCFSNHTKRNGYRYNKNIIVEGYKAQRHKCLDCGRRWTVSTTYRFKHEKDVKRIYEVTKSLRETASVLEDLYNLHVCHKTVSDWLKLKKCK
jgi:transposase-like protein